MQIGLKKFFIHSTDLLNPSLREKVFAGFAAHDQFMSRYWDPVAARAQAAGYSPKLDDTWLHKLTLGEKLNDIINGKVDFKKYLGDRYSPEMVNFAKAAAKGLYDAPPDVGFDRREQYDLRRRVNYENRVPMYGRDGQPLSEADEMYSTFLHQRKLEKPIDLKHSKLDKETPWLSLYKSAMERRGLQKTFQPGKMVNGRYVLDKGSLLEELYHKFTDRNAPETERHGAKVLYDTIRGHYHLDNTFNKIARNHSDAVFTNNLGVVYNHALSAATLPHVPYKTMAWSWREMGNPAQGTVQLLKEARVSTEADIRRDISDPNNVQFTPKGIDAVKIADKRIRSAIYLAAAKDYAERNRIPWEDVVSGKGLGMRARAHALSELQGVYGSASKYSFRGGGKQVPGLFYLKNAHMAGIQRTVQDLRGGDLRHALLHNLIPRIALNGGRAITDPPTLALIRSMLPPQQANTVIQGLTNSENDADPGLLHSVDKAFGTNFSSRTTLLDSGLVSDANVLPVDPNYILRTVARINDPKTSTSQKRDAALDTFAYLSTLAPKSTFEIGGVRVSSAQLLKFAEAAFHFYDHQQGGSEVYYGRPVPYSPAAEAMAVAGGGFGPRTQRGKEEIRNALADKQFLRNEYASEKRNYGKGHGGSVAGYQRSPQLNANIEQYQKLHGGNTATIRDELRQGYGASRGAAYEELKGLARQYKQSGNDRQKIYLQRKIDEYNRENPGKHTSLGELKSTVRND